MLSNNTTTKQHYLQSLLPSQALLHNDGSNFHIVHPLWDYEDCLKFQERACDYILENPSEKIFILTSHHPLYTLGRGLQRKTSQKLEDFSEEVIPKLQYPLHKIFRGGGITFHHPGQIILYPIIKLDSAKWNMDFHLKFFMRTIETFAKDQFKINVKGRRDPLGVWYQDRKIASIGIGLKKFVTQHGVALNISNKNLMASASAAVNPCGLPAETYESIESIINEKIQVEELFPVFLETIKKDLANTL